MTDLPPAPWAVDLSARSKFRFRGADRVRFLNGQVSNDVRLASESSAFYTCVMTAKGKMCGDAFVHAQVDCLMMDAPEELRESLAARLERYIISDDVALEDVTDSTGLFHVFGGDGVAAAVAPASHRFGQAGRDLWQDEAPLGINLLDAAQAEWLRVRAGIPKWGTELGEDVMPAEAGLDDRAVSFSKGCYIGQEVVSRIKSVGRVNWILRGFRSLEGEMFAGAPLHAGDDSKPVGRITSVAAGPAASAALALGYTRRGFENAGTVLRTDAGQVEVCSLPFA